MASSEKLRNGLACDLLPEVPWMNLPISGFPEAIGDTTPKFFNFVLEDGCELHELHGWLASKYPKCGRMVI